MPAHTQPRPSRTRRLTDLLRVRVDPELRRRLVASAEANERTESGEARVAINAHLRRQEGEQS